MGLPRTVVWATATPHPMLAEKTAPFLFVVTMSKTAKNSVMMATPTSKPVITVKAIAPFVAAFAPSYQGSLSPVGTGPYKALKNATMGLPMMAVWATATPLPMPVVKIVRRHTVAMASKTPTRRAIPAAPLIFIVHTESRAVPSAMKTVNKWMAGLSFVAMA